MEPDAHDRTVDRLRDALDAPPEHVQRLVTAALDAPHVSSGAPWFLALTALVVAAVVYTGVGRLAEPEAFRIVGDRTGVSVLRPGGTPVEQVQRSEESGSILIVLTSGGDSEQNP